MRELRLLGCAVVLAAALSACGASDSEGSAPAPQPASGPLEVIDCSFDKPAVRPAHLILACADLGMRIEDIGWKSWAADRAEGEGTARINTCDPNCAAGNFITEPVRIVLTEPIEPGHVYTKATTVDPAGKTRTWPLTRR
ncbi:hypothetical protein [Nocardia pseudobrasiliensis]|uniref:Lipoprotein n=1 Tax=Nocardia pseudobrasiliensis TaxID=45979 RepID=A0A370I068_9NOCA|nr:hypothetical protein [Nocardia pseudobrasiliensis]RDI64119.1 hypothetical protein DFR76_109460 [Nocardia pseudobrasiliensis]